MELEPESVTMESQAGDPELVRMTRRFRLSVLLSVPVLVLAISDDRSHSENLPSCLLLLVPDDLGNTRGPVGGWPFFVHGARSIGRGMPICLR